MSHSQFHSIESFILRHAWLSLWDKHMTTGRINQVTTARHRGAHYPTNNVQLPCPSAPSPEGVGCPRLVKHDTTLSCKASRTVPQRRDDRRLLRARSSPAPVMSTCPPVDNDLNTQTTRFNTRKRCNPTLPRPAPEQDDDTSGRLARVQRPNSQICSASQAMPLPGRLTAHGTPAISSAEQRLVRTDSSDGNQQHCHSQQDCWKPVWTHPTGWSHDLIWMWECLHAH